MIGVANPQSETNLNSNRPFEGIKNPISLAKIIRDASIQPLSLSRVPPNILVGIGATKFAQEHGMPTVVNECLVSRNAKERFIRWHQDLEDAEADMGSTPYPDENAGVPALGEYGNPSSQPHAAMRQDHLNALLSATWNEGQPNSPSRKDSPKPENAFLGRNAPDTPSYSNTSSPGTTPTGGKPQALKNPLSPMRPQALAYLSDGSSLAPSILATNELPSAGTIVPGGSTSFDYLPDSGDDRPGAQEALEERHDFDAGHDRKDGSTGLNKDKDEGDDVDMISDTVGVIAIDLMGRIAAGSSSGGIGMKHAGRIGPAALVGIGTAVIPADPDDEDGVSVAAVTSGTGEHMATSFASLRCAERLYHSSRRGPCGQDVEEFDDDAVIESFITMDFMGHPGVKNQPTPGAIGVMAVKQTKSGYYFYFAHNTDSFALASMSSTEPEPLCTMSRTGRSGGVIRGGRKIRID